MEWPSKSEREGWEIKAFLGAYGRFYPNRRLSILEKREKPDYFLVDQETQNRLSVELTSVYASDRSVLTEHIQPIPMDLRLIGIRDDPAELESYRARLVATVRSKVKKARNDYDLRYPMVLSIYVNDLRAIFMDGAKDWQTFVEANEAVFDNCAPFAEIVFWSLPNGMALLVKP